MISFWSYDRCFGLPSWPIQNLHFCICYIQNLFSIYRNILREVLPKQLPWQKWRNRGANHAPPSSCYFTVLFFTVFSEVGTSADQTAIWKMAESTDHHNNPSVHIVWRLSCHRSSGHTIFVGNIFIIFGSPWWVHGGEMMSTPPKTLLPC